MTLKGSLYFAGILTHIYFPCKVSYSENKQKKYDLQRRLLLQTMDCLVSKHAKPWSNQIQMSAYIASVVVAVTGYKSVKFVL